MKAQSIYLADEAATIALASRLHQALVRPLGGWTVLLEGALGAGKSTFARGLIRAFGHGGAVPSPTYTLVEPYELPEVTIYHIDLYRIADADELRYLGFNELDQGLRLIEWPERSPGLLESSDLRIRLGYEGTGRAVVVEALTPRAADVVGALTDTH